MANPFLDSFLKRAMPGVENNTEKANEIVRTRVMWSVGAGMMPVPVLDIAAVSAVQLDMINQLAALYKVDFSEAVGKGLLSALAGSTLARVGASFVKAIPVVGSILGGASMAVLSGASTYAVGMVFISHFERGGNLNDFNINAYKEAYDDFFQKGKNVADTVKQQSESESLDAYSRLEKLQKLRERAIITDEEFESKKAEILRDM